MKTKEKPASVSRKEKVRKSQTSVLDALNWSEEQYCEYQFEQGCIFLEHYIGEGTPYGDVLIKNKIFWNWWKNQWQLRDQYFLTRMELGHIQRWWHPEVWYKITNDGEKLAHNIHPNRAVMDLSYAQMINEFIETEKQKS